jgi:hypothetical protein
MIYLLLQKKTIWTIYTNVTTDLTLIGPNQFMPASNPVPSGTAPFVGSAVAFHTLSGAKFTVTYTLDATANTPIKIIPKVLS